MINVISIQKSRDNVLGFFMNGLMNKAFLWMWLFMDRVMNKVMDRFMNGAFLNAKPQRLEIIGFTLI
jgi:hypothetical protein